MLHAVHLMRLMSLVFVFTMLLCAACLAQSNATDSVTITTYYPAPYGVYKNMRLHPSQEPQGAAAQRGTLYFNATTNQTYYFNGSAWVPFNFFANIQFNTAAVRPSDTEGTVYYNVSSHQPEYFDGNQWKAFGGGSSGNMCGNSFCETGEDCGSCPQDCPTCATPAKQKKCAMHVVASYNPGIRMADLYASCRNYCISKGWKVGDQYQYHSSPYDSSHPVACSYPSNSYATYPVTFRFDDCTATKSGTTQSGGITYCTNTSIATCYCNDVEGSA
ncbi:MAG: hypothetical protein PHT59_02235 [Candidatus Omnitrophica bacterium]|nr:hypothetical protein [Candidatus Omnitrophota bacterium]